MQILFSGCKSLRSFTAIDVLLDAYGSTRLLVVENSYNLKDKSMRGRSAYQCHSSAATIVHWLPSSRQERCWSPRPRQSKLPAERILLTSSLFNQNTTQISRHTLLPPSGTLPYTLGLQEGCIQRCCPQRSRHAVIMTKVSVKILKKAR